MAVQHIPKMGKGRLFDNPVLERLSRTPAFIAYTLYPAVILFFLAVNIWWLPVSKTAMLWSFIGGMIIWTLFEYVIHRYLFHFIAESEKAKRFFYTIHGIHHDYPKDSERLIMPPLPWTSLTSLLLLTSWIIIGNAGFTFMAGMLTGYLGYIYIHYQIHLNNPPKFLRKMMVHHALHHYKHDDLAFGVSSKFWDRVFGTMPSDNRVKG